MNDRAGCPVLPPVCMLFDPAAAKARLIVLCRAEEPPPGLPESSRNRPGCQVGIRSEGMQSRCRRPRRPGLSDAGDGASSGEADARAMPLASLSRDIRNPSRKGDEEIQARAAVLGGLDCPTPATEQAAGRLTLGPCCSPRSPPPPAFAAGGEGGRLSR